MRHCFSREYGNSLHSNPLPRGEGAYLRLSGSCGLALFCFDPPPSRRVELNGSGAPSGMTAQPQLVQGCTICGVPSDPESEVRESAVGGRLGGGGLSFGDFSLATQRKATRPAPKGGRNPVEGSPSRPMRRSRIKGSTAGSGIRRESVVVEQTISCGAMRCAYCTLRCSTAWQSHAIRGIRRIWAFGLTPPGSRASEYATLFEPTGPHHIDNLRGTLTPLTLALSRRERGQRYRKQKR